MQRWLKPAVVIGLTVVFSGVFYDAPTCEAGFLNDVISGVTGKKAVSKQQATDIDKVLMSALKAGDLDLATQAVENGANVNVYLDGKLPLDIALNHLANRGNYDFAELLINNGADIEGWIDYNNNGKKHYYAFTHRQSNEVILYLLDKGLDPNLEWDYGIRLINVIIPRPSYSTRSTRRTMLEALVERGAEVDAAPKANGNLLLKGQTALMQAAQVNDVECINYLLSVGADPKKRDGKGKRALDYALQENKIEAIKILMPVS